MPIPRRRALAGAVVLIACMQYFVAEAISAAAWRDPPYSYARNFISDLGMPDCGATLGRRLICSPLSGLMNASFLVEAALVVVALMLLLPLLAGRPWRVAVAGLACTHAAGIAMVGIWHAGPQASGAMTLHVTGAGMAIIGGNLMIAVAGLASWRAGAPGWFALASLGLSLLGVCGTLALSWSTILPPGVFERLAVDGISVWKIATGLFLAIALARQTTGAAHIDLPTLRAARAARPAGRLEA